MTTALRKKEKPNFSRQQTSESLYSIKSNLCNAENFLIIRNKKLAEIYINNWCKHIHHFEKYKYKEGNKQ